MVASTVQFHPTCDKIEQHFRNEWSKNLKDMNECKNAAVLLETIITYASTLNLEDDFKDTPVHPNRPGSYGMKNKTKEKEEEENEAERTIASGKAGKPKASQKHMPPKMWQEYMKYPENTTKLPYQLWQMRKWCTTNTTCYRCYKEDCFKIFKDENATKEDKDNNYAKCIEFAKTEGYTNKPKPRGKEKKENKTIITTQTTDELEVPTGITRPWLPLSLEDLEKKNQMCTPVQTNEPNQLQILKHN